MSDELLVDGRRSVGIGVRNADLSGERIVRAKCFLLIFAATFPPRVVLEVVRFPDPLAHHVLVSCRERGTWPHGDK